MMFERPAHQMKGSVEGGRGECGSRQRGSWGAFSRNRALTLGTGGRGAYIVNCTLIIWILPSGALFYDQNVQNASCRLTFGVFAFPVTIHNGDKKKALEYIKRK